MKRHTVTTLGQLRIGDRFCFLDDKKQVVKEAIRFKNSSVCYNKIDHKKQKYAWVFNRSKPKNRPVLFIRHTILQPGDECFMQDLKEGDVFTKPGSNKEMRVVKKRLYSVSVRYVGQTQHLDTSPLTTGIFVRRASLKKKAKNV